MLPDNYLVEFRPGTCQWQLTNERCQLPAMFRKPYCLEHHNIAYKTTTEEGARFVAEQELKKIDDDTLYLEIEDDT